MGDFHIVFLCCGYPDDYNNYNRDNAGGDIMNNKEKWDKINQLETEAKNRYTDMIEWDEVIAMLSKDDQELYYGLINEIGED